MLDHLAYVIEQTDLVRPLVERQLFRGRKRQPGEVFDETAQLGAPTAQRAEAQRMSPAGIWFFYGSGEAETCLAELHGLQGEFASVGRWLTTQPFSVLDLVDLPRLRASSIHCMARFGICSCLRAGLLGRSRGRSSLMIALASTT
jgi:hypothetical protein